MDLLPTPDLYYCLNCETKGCETAWGWWTPGTTTDGRP